MTIFARVPNETMSTIAIRRELPVAVAGRGNFSATISGLKGREIGPFPQHTAIHRQTKNVLLSMIKSRFSSRQWRKLLLWSAGPIILLIATWAYMNRTPTNEELAERYAIALSTGKTKGVEKYVAPWELKLNELNHSQAARVMRNGLHPMLQGYKYQHMIPQLVSDHQYHAQAVFVKDGKEWPVTIYVERLNDQPYIFLGLTATSLWESEYMYRDKHGESEINWRIGAVLGTRRDANFLDSLGLKGVVTNDPELQNHVPLWKNREKRFVRELAEYNVTLD